MNNNSKRYVATGYSKIFGLIDGSRDEVLIVPGNVMIIKGPYDIDMICEDNSYRTTCMKSPVTLFYSITPDVDTETIIAVLKEKGKIKEDDQDTSRLCV